MSRVRFECPRCGNTHTAVLGEMTYARYMSSLGVIETCQLRVAADRDGEHMIVEFFKTVEERSWKIRSNRVRAEAA